MSVNRRKPNLRLGSALTFACVAIRFGCWRLRCQSSKRTGILLRCIESAWWHLTDLPILHNNVRLAWDCVAKLLAALRTHNYRNGVFESTLCACALP